MAATPHDDLERIDPSPVIVTLSTGVQCALLRLKTRQFFRFLRILTHGAGPMLRERPLNFQGDPAEFMQQLLVMVVFAIPDAEQEAMEFVQSMCQPPGIKDEPASRLTKAEREHNQELWVEMNMDLFNPTLEDTLDIIEAIVRQEATDIQELGKRLGRLLELAQKMGQTTPEKPAEAPVGQDLTSPESSPASSTSSSTSTAGPTSASSASPSAGSGKSSPQLVDVVGMKSATGES